jgi:proteasome beta subunit
VIYFYDPLGAHFEAAAFAASGSGMTTIKSVLFFLESWGNPRPADMPLKEAVVLANRLLMTAAEYDAATGGVHAEQQQFATIKLLSGKGVRAISSQEQAELWKQDRHD